MNQKGFSLISVIVASSVMMVVGLGISTLIFDMSKSQNYLKFNADANTINEEMRALLSSPRACENSFAGQTVVPASNIAITNLFDGSAAPGIARYTQGLTYGDRSLILTSMNLTNYVAGPTANLATMTLTSVFATAKNASGPQQLVRSINLSVTKNPATNALTTCIALSKMSDGIWQRSVANTNNIFFASPLAPLTGGNVGIGIDNPWGILELQDNGNSWPNVVVNTDSSTLANPKWPGFIGRGYSNNNTSPIFNFERARGTRAAPLALQNQDKIGGIGGFGYSGAGFDASGGIAPSVYITFLAEGAFTNTSTPTSIIFSTANVGENHGIERMRVQPNGNIGIGLINPSTKLHVFGDGRFGTGGTNGCVQNASGGAIAGTCSSDARLKKNIRPLGEVSKKLSQLKPKFYFWRSDEFPEKSFGHDEQLGLIAQDLIDIFPELIEFNEDKRALAKNSTSNDQNINPLASDDFYKIKFHHLPFYLLQGFSEQYNKLQSLENSTSAEIAKLKQIVLDIQNENKALRKNNMSLKNEISIINESNKLKMDLLSKQNKRILKRLESIEKN